MFNSIYIQTIFSESAFSICVFKELPIKCLFKKHYKWFFNITCNFLDF